MANDSPFLVRIIPNWDENKHPRDRDGKFTDGGGFGGGGSRTGEGGGWGKGPRWQTKIPSDDDLLHTVIEVMDRAGGIHDASFVITSYPDRRFKVVRSDTGRTVPMSSLRGWRLREY